MKDKADIFLLENLDSPIIHGHVKIITKTRHGLVNKVEGENTFQADVLAKQLNTHGEFGLPNWYDYGNLVGGIFLFRDAVPANSRFMPAGNKMVAQGYRGSTTQGTYPLLGTFNTSESSANENAITQVYDYATNQANGTIKSVCLTSKKGGQIGYGVGPDGIPYSTSLNFSDIQGGNLGEVGAQGGFYNGYRYYVSGYSNGVLTIQKKPVDVETGNIFRDFTKNLTFDVTEIGTARPVSPYWNMMGDCGNGVFRFWSERDGSSPLSVGDGGTIYYYEFDAKTDTLSQGTLTNTSGSTLSLANYGVQFFGSKCFINTGTSSSLQSSNTYVFDVDNNTFIQRLTGTGNFAMYNGNTAMTRIPGEISDDLFIMVGVNSSGSGEYLFLYDAVAGTTERVNLQWGTSQAQLTLYTQMRSAEGLLKMRYRYSANQYFGNVVKNPLYLATIYNLNTSVTKDVSMTMKVIYTLTEA